MLEYDQELDFINEIDDSEFPDFLFSILFNDFNEEYYHRGAGEDPLKKIARAIRRKYNNFFDYLDALQAYNDYMDILLEKYGSYAIIKSLYTAGLLEEVLPPKPKLKDKRINRRLLRLGIIPSRQIDKPLPGEYREIGNKLFKESGEPIDELDSLTKPNKTTLKRLTESSNSIGKNMRRKNLYNGGVQNCGIDIQLDYYAQLNRGEFKPGTFKSSPITLHEIYEEDKRLEGMTPAQIESELTDRQGVMYNGQWCSVEKVDQLKFYTFMNEMGFDIMGSAKKNLDQKSFKLLKTTVSVDQPLTKKQQKQYKKRMKKEQKQLERRRDNDAQLSQILCNNKFSFNHNDNGVNFRLRDIYKDEDE